MRWRQELHFIIRRLIHRRRAEQELDEEIRAHMEMEIERNVADGMSHEEARLAARRSFGSVALAKEDSRAMWGFVAVEMLWLDLRFASRRLAKTRGFTLLALLSLALGIGANTAVFSLVNTVLLRPLPVENPERLVSFDHVSEKGGDAIPVLSYLNYRDLRDRNNVLDGLIAYRMSPISLSYDGTSERAWIYLATGNYFDVLGVKPALGRLLTPEDDKAPGAHPVTVISYNCWQKRFASDPNVVGRNVMVNSRNFTIIGVAPPGFYGAEIGYVSEMWFPMMMLDQIVLWGNDLGDRSGQSYQALGRLKQGVTRAQAEASLKAVMAQLAREYPNDNQGQTIRLSAPGLFGSYFRGPVLGFAGALMAAAGLVLLLACANLANLLLARALERRKEIAIRLAIGAGRMRIIRQLLTESFLLSMIGGAAGLLLAFWLVDAITSFNLPVDFPILTTLHLDHRVLIFTFAVSLLTGALFGLAPALQSTKPDLAPTLKDEISAGGYRRSLLRNGLVVFQVALSLVLLIGAGLVLRGLQRAHALFPGFTPQNAIMMSFDLGMQGYDGARAKVFKRQLLERVSALPSVQSAGLADYIPFDLMFRNNGVSIEGQTDWQSARRGAATPGFLGAIGARLIEGRDFTAAEYETNRSVAVVNETFARRFWKGETAVGKRFWFGGTGGTVGPWTEIIGVIQDGKYSSLSEEATPLFYANLQHDYGWNLSLVVRTANEPQSVIAAIRGEIRQLDRHLPVFNVKTMNEQMNWPLFPARFASALFGGFGLLALFLTAIGLFGVMSCAVSQRRREISIRMALGAARRDVLKLVIGRGMLLALLGVAAGLAAAFALTRLMSTLLFDVKPTDPLTFSLIALLLGAVTLLACWIPARRATKVDPLTALKYE